MVHGKKRIPYWIDWRLPGLAGPEYHAVISFGLPIEPEDSQYGEYRSNPLVFTLPTIAFEAYGLMKGGTVAYVTDHHTPNVP